MKTLHNGICVLEHDSHLSKWIEEQGHLIMHQDLALQRNLAMIRSGDVVVDGGAALGDHTAAYLDAVGPTGLVYAFEPNPLYVSCLVKNCPTSMWYDRALWFEEAWLWMQIPNIGNVGSARVGAAGNKRVEAIRLDFLCLPKCNFIKLDVEGAELMALRGAVETIKRFHPIIQCEVNPPLMDRMGYTEADLIEWLENAGYVVELFGNRSDVGACELMAV